MRQRTPENLKFATNAILQNWKSAWVSAFRFGLYDFLYIQTQPFEQVLLGTLIHLQPGRLMADIKVNCTINTCFDGL